MRACHPDRFGILLVNLDMSGVDGLELMGAVRECCPQLPLVAIGADGDVRLAVEAMKAGAFEFIEKLTDTKVLVDLIGQAQARAKTSFEEITRHQQAKALIARLTNRELEVLSYLVAGQQTKEIAESLDLSARTVEVHRANIIKKLEVTNVAGVVRAAIEAGIEEAPSA